jgi:hypothetical protein
MSHQHHPPTSHTPGIDISRKTLRKMVTECAKSARGTRHAPARRTPEPPHHFNPAGHAGGPGLGDFDGHERLRRLSALLRSSLRGTPSPAGPGRGQRARRSPSRSIATPTRWNSSSTAVHSAASPPATATGSARSSTRSTSRANCSPSPTPTAPKPAATCCAWADRPVRVEVSGAGVLLGFGSASPSTEERFDATERRTYDGRALAVLRPTGPGKIRLIASAPECEPAEVLVTAELRRPLRHPASPGPKNSFDHSERTVGAPYRRW